MKTYIALFRGINVGGNNILPMKDLVVLLEKLGSCYVKTYIQSGNAVFGHKTEQASELSKRIRAEIRGSHGFEPEVFLLQLVDLKTAIASNPFPEAESEPRTLHLFFLHTVPENPDLKGLENTRQGRERFKLIDRVLYLHAPDGVGRSKLAARAEKLLGVPVTARNWRTVGKIMTLAGSAPEDTQRSDAKG